MKATPVLTARRPKRRRVQVAVISDVHLGTYGCHAPELLRYLKSIRPEVLVLNGDIVDIWQFSKNYWPPAHMRVVRHLAARAAQNFEYYAGVVTELHGRSFQVGDEFLNYTIHKPVGVAGMIMPWNAPLMLSTWRIAPALAAGNTIVLKPA